MGAILEIEKRCAGTLLEIEKQRESDQATPLGRSRGALIARTVSAMSPPSSGSPFADRPWLGDWLRTAGVGTLILTALFVLYEIVERAWLLEWCSTEQLFRFHVYRGVGCSIALGTWAFYNTRRLRRRYDQAFLAAYHDLEVAHEKRTEALARQQKFLDRLLDTLADRVAVLDPSGQLLKANRVALAAPGSGELGRSCGQLGSACCPGDDNCVAQRALAEHRAIVGQVRRADPRTGRVYAVDAYPVPDPESGRDVVIEVQRDVTEAQQYEMRIRSQEKLAALGVLSAGIAHDIANPLASLSSELELLENEADPGRIQRSLTVLRKEATRIGRALRETTDFARRRGDERTLVSVEVAVADALRMVRHDRRARRIRFETKIDPGLPELHLGEDQLVMILVNLLLNSFDAMPDGGTIALSAHREGGAVELRVRDTGVGMEGAVLARATEPLFTTKPCGGGTGLGLSVSADVMRAAGGALELESEPGAGTTVRLRFPARPTDHGAEAHA
jgi:signal transduction histidine kinase